MRVSDRLPELLAQQLDPHTLLICEPYGVKGGSSSRHYNVEQPFSVKIHPDVALVCDLHAHLADSEIIGFLAGRFDRAENCVYVQAPFPCRATPRADEGATDVEMDPASEIEIRGVIDKLNMEVGRGVKGSGVGEWG